MQGRTLHPNKLRRAGDVAAEAVDLRDQIFTLEHFARLAQRQAHQLLAADAAGHCRHQRADLAGQHVGGDLGVGVAGGQDHQPLDIVAQLADIAGPVVRLQHRHRIGGDRAGGAPMSALTRSRKCSISAGMSSRAARRARASGIPHDRQAVEQILAFLPADIISQILNFGAPAPIDVQITGPNAAANQAYAQSC